MPSHVPTALERWCQRTSIATLVVTAHPDDEILGTGGLLHPGAHVAFVHTTDGAPRELSFVRAAGFTRREQLVRARREELRAALQCAGLERAPCRELGFIDQEAAFDMPAIARALVQLLDELRPQLVLTHAYEGGHPDHDATALAVHAAVASLACGRGPVPELAEMAGYHGHGGQFRAGEFLPSSSHAIIEITLEPDARARKQAMLECFVSQRWVLAQFDTRVERFRLAPRHDFTRPPHSGPLLYEQLGWGLSGARFCELARASLGSLGLGS